MTDINSLDDPLLLAEHIIGVYYDDFEPDFIGKFLLNYRNLFELKPQLIMDAVGEGWVDLQRMGNHHLPTPEQQPDHHKYAAFMAKWIAKTRPITCQFEKLPDGTPYKLAMRINAYFAKRVFRSLLLADIPENLDRDLVYTFHHRDEKPETLSILAYCCERISLLEKELERCRDNRQNSKGQPSAS